MQKAELVFTIFILFLGVLTSLFIRFVVYSKVKDMIDTLDEPIAWHSDCLVFTIFIITASLSSDRDLPLWLAVVLNFSFIIHDISSIFARRILGLSNNRNLYNSVYVVFGLILIFILLFIA